MCSMTAAESRARGHDQELSAFSFMVSRLQRTGNTGNKEKVLEYSHSALTTVPFFLFCSGEGDFH